MPLPAPLEHLHPRNHRVLRPHAGFSREGTQAHAVFIGIRCLEGKPLLRTHLQDTHPAATQLHHQARNPREGDAERREEQGRTRRVHLPAHQVGQVIRPQGRHHRCTALMDHRINPQDEPGHGLRPHRLKQHRRQPGSLPRNHIQEGGAEVGEAADWQQQL